MAKKGVIAEICANLPPPTPLSWEHRVAPEHKPTLVEIKAAYRDGAFGTKRVTAARAISKFLNDNRISTVGPQGVIQWLAKP